MWPLLALARAAAATPPASSPPEREEYTRLSEELERLAAKNAWIGVERTFEELLGTGVPPSWDDWWRGAQAARATGDIAAARERLRSANAIREDRAVIDTLWEIDGKFGAVTLSCDPSSYLELDAASSPFDPDLLRAIEFAESAIHDRCSFSGLLPVGQYKLYDRMFDVAAHQDPLVIDLRGLEIDRRTHKKLREEWLAAGSEGGGGSSAASAPGSR